jgi:lipopolysaccharide transport system ATP-binding protein
MRLAFAVAAHLEPEILVVDEVLAVGDAQFQKKCLGKMAEVAGIGRTVLLVSHQMPAITGLCSRVIVLQKGRVAFDGPTQQGVQFYLRSSDNAAPQSLAERTDRSGSGAIRFTSAWIEDEGGHPVDTVCSGQDVRLVITYTASAGHVVSSLTVAFALKDAMGGQLSDLWSEGTGAIWQQVAPEGTVVCRIPCLPLNAGRYSFNAIGRVNTIIADWLSDVATFDVVAGDFYGSGRIPDASQGQFLFQQTWTLE